jgi:hypothetical protein
LDFFVWFFPFIGIDWEAAMKHFLAKSAWLTLTLAFAGCDSISPTPDWQKAFAEIIDAEGELVDALHGVTDAGSARAAISNLEAKFIRATNARKNFAPFMNACAVSSPFGGMTFDEFGRKSGDYEEQHVIDKYVKKGTELKGKFNSELKRLHSISGLPIEFWKIVDFQSVNKEVTVHEIGYHSLPGGDERLQQEYRLRDLLSSDAYDETVKVDFIDLWHSLYFKVCEKLKKATPTINTHHYVSTEDRHVAYFARVKDFKAFVASIDFGKVIFQDEGQRLVRVQVDPSKLGAMGKSEEEEQVLAREARKKEQDEAENKFNQKWRKVQEEIREQAKKEAGPYPNEPDYYEKLAEMMLSTDRTMRDRAINALLVQPSKMPSVETKGQIARGFKKLAEDDHFLSDDKIVKGLVLWGGKYSAPVLLKLLDNSHLSAKKEIIASLGKSKLPEAATALAALLGDISFHQEAYNALNEMGSVAENAVINVAPSNDERTCLYAVKLLGEWGTDKSVSVLRKGLTTRNQVIREAVKEALKKVAARQKEAKAK